MKGASLAALLALVAALKWKIIIFNRYRDEECLLLKAAPTLKDSVGITKDILVGCKVIFNAGLNGDSLLDTIKEVHQKSEERTRKVLTAAAARVPTRIVGGQSTTIERYPSVVQVEFRGVLSGAWSHNCAASILTSLWVLSSANCFSGLLYRPDLRRIRAGATYRNDGGYIVDVASEHNHDEFNVILRDADISVVRLASPLTYSATVQPTTIVSQGWAIPDNIPVGLVGWGTNETGGAYAVELQEVSVLTVNNDVCRERYASLIGNYPVTARMICAGLEEGGRDACQGDSGGPLLLDNIAVGIVGWGLGCAQPNFPGVTTSVAHFSDWIVQTVLNNS